MSRILISRLWLTTRRDGSQIIAGKFGFDGKLRIETNPEKVAENDPDFLAFIEYQQPKPQTGAPSFRAPQLTPPRPLGAFIEGEVVE